MTFESSWRVIAVLGLWLGGFSLGWGDEPLDELKWRRCAIAIAIDGMLVCDDDMPSAATKCAKGAQAPLTIWPGDAVVCDAQIGWQRVGRAPARAAALLQVPVDLNQASIDELVNLPFVGEKRAQQWILARPLRSWAQVDAMPGIGPKRLATLQRHGYVINDEVGCIGLEQHAMWSGVCRAGVR